ncbi:TlpA disulfide reductase family protein [Deminuibacter soli]|uniref:AhpC/TSA family protein n=1 Tax=Deminuibacter soli TaxID=2291815 RepID=A0A3E1ND66_9BACT|nr:TlpA disulfide reductase family protein [Deminuibacter soli]RFM25880.1 AhpC/TSA family protein [Deminuibacter soli]
MKKTLLLLTMLIPAALWAQDGSVTIKGQLNNVKGAKKIYLLHRDHGGLVIDSATVTDNQYVIKAKVSELTQAVLLLNTSNGRALKSEGDAAPLFIEPASFSITHKDSLANFTTTGSVLNDEAKKLKTAEQPFNQKGATLNAAYRAAQASGDTAKLKQLDAEGDKLEADLKEQVYGPYVKGNPNSPLAIYALNLYAGFADIDVAKVEPLYNSLPATAQNSKGGKDFKQRLDAVKKTAIGSEALDFTQADTLGKPVSLSSFRGHYVLVDFWASWCGPCRRENPNVVKAFNKFKDKGFHIIGVSLDQPGAQKSWLDAIHKDGLVWTHVSDLQYWNNAVAKSYGINSIPANFLIDPSGKIIAKSLRGEDLESKLAEVYK